jgi:prepilin-type N-terminal cleavage/methylation domain-containing protein
MRAQRGFSLVEVLAALFVLTIVITTTLGMFVQRKKHLKNAAETIIVYQAFANEIELWRRFDFAGLEDKAADGTFYCDATILQPLRPYETKIDVKATSPTTKNVKLTITWGDKKAPRSASINVVRCNTGGTNLW